MPRLVNTVFQGARQIDVDAGAKSNRRVLQNAVGDVNMIADALFDSTAAAFPHTHRGNVAGVYTGAPLGVPLSGGGATFVGTSSTNMLQESAAKIVATGIIMSSVLVWTPSNERTLRVEYPADGTEDLILYAFAQPVSSWASPWFNDDNIPMETVNGMRVATLSVTSETLYHVGVYLQPIIVGSLINLPAAGEYIAPLLASQVIVHFGRTGSRAPTYTWQNIAPADVVPVGTATVGGATVPSIVMPQSGGVADNQAFSAAHAGLVNRAQNTLDEYVTGAPAAMDTTTGLRLTSDASTSAFQDHSQRGAYKANEPACALPVFAECGVAVGGDGDDIGLGYAAGSPSSGAIYRVLCMMPDFKSTSSTKLHVGAIVCYTGTGTPTASIQMQTASGSNVGSAVTPTMVQLGSSKLWYCDGTPATFTADGLNRVEYSFSRSGASGGIYAVCRSAWFQH